MAYHGGNPTLTTSTLTVAAASKIPALISKDRNRTSLFDEQILHWTRIATRKQITQARADSINAADHLLKSIAYMWNHTLDLIQATINQGEYFADDNQASLDSSTAGSEWRARLNNVATSLEDIHFLRRQMAFFQFHLRLNLERLGVTRNGDRMVIGDGGALPAALIDAQRDFSHLHGRLQPYVGRMSALSQLANEITSLHTSFKSVQDSEFGLIISTIAVVVFPATLVASIFSMGGNFLPGRDQFWVFWAAVVPLTVSLALLMMFSGVIRRFVERQAASWKRAYLARRRARGVSQLLEGVTAPPRHVPSSACNSLYLLGALLLIYNLRITTTFMLYF